MDIQAMSGDRQGRGGREVATTEIDLYDQRRERGFTCALWHPRADSASARAGRDGLRPLIVFSHHSGGDRRSSSFLCRHLAGHGYVVAAVDHADSPAARTSRPSQPTAAVDEAAGDRAGRVAAIVASRVPDVRFLLDRLLQVNSPAGIAVDAERVGLIGNSLGGWTVLATAEADARVAAVAALAPGGSSEPRPGVLRLSLTFERPRAVPTLFLAAGDDVQIPPEHVAELYARAPAPKRMAVMRHADHQHFLDDVEQAHEAVRAADFPGEASWIPAATKPFAELAPARASHAFACCLTLLHFDAELCGSNAARQLLDGDVVEQLAAYGADVTLTSTST